VSFEYLFNSCDIQDFLPCSLVGYFSNSLSAIPSLLEFIPEISESLADGALWFNFVFGEHPIYKFP
jgi:hypothetical protein